MSEELRYIVPASAIKSTVAKSIAKPDAFSKPGAFKPAKPGVVRFRPMAARRGPGRPRLHRADPRKVQFF